MRRMNAYSEDLRKKIVEALERGGATKSEADRAFGVSRSSVKRYAKLAWEGLPLAPKKRPDSKPKMDESARKLLEADAHRRPAATLFERRSVPGEGGGRSGERLECEPDAPAPGVESKKGRWVRQNATSS